MIKKISLILVVIVVSINGFSQEYTGLKNNISFGYGFGNLSNSILKNYQSYDLYKYESFGPIYGKYESRLSQLLGVGANITYMEGNGSFITKDTTGSTIIDYQNKVNRKSFNIMIRGNLHLGKSEVFDPYIGLSFGYRRNQWEVNFDDPRLGKLNVSNFLNFNPIGIEATIGSKFLFTENFGAYVEMGLARSFIQFGLTANF